MSRKGNDVESKRVGDKNGAVGCNSSIEKERLSLKMKCVGGAVVECVNSIRAGGGKEAGKIPGRRDEGEMK